MFGREQHSAKGGRGYDHPRRSASYVSDYEEFNRARFELPLGCSNA